MVSIYIDLIPIILTHAPQIMQEDSDVCNYCIHVPHIVSNETNSERSIYMIIGSLISCTHAMLDSVP